MVAPTSGLRDVDFAQLRFLRADAADEVAGATFGEAPRSFGARAAQTRKVALRGHSACCTGALPVPPQKVDHGEILIVSEALALAQSRVASTIAVRLSERSSSAGSQRGLPCASRWMPEPLTRPMIVVARLICTAQAPVILA